MKRLRQLSIEIEQRTLTVTRQPGVAPPVEQTREPFSHSIPHDGVAAAAGDLPASGTKGIAMKKISHFASLLGSLICAAGFLGQAAPALNAQTSPKIEAWYQQMMQPRKKAAGCYTATWPNTQWMTVPCGGATASSTPGVQARSTTKVHPLDETSSGDYVAQSEGTISSAVGTLTIANNNSAYGPGLVPNNFSIQLNTNTFTSTSQGCSWLAGCLGWMQFVVGSEGLTLMQNWLIGYFYNAANTACPEGYAQADGPNCYANFGVMQLPGAFPFLALSGLQLTGDTDSGYDTNTLFLPQGYLLQAVIPDSHIGLGGQWRDAEFNTFGYGNGEETFFSAGTDVNVLLALKDGTDYSPTCLGDYTFTAESTNLVENPCYAFASPSPGIQFEEAVPPIVQSISPNFGNAAGGNTVNVLGQGFSPKMQAVFGSKVVNVNVAGCTFPSEVSESCTIVTPPGAGVESFTLANIGVEGAPLASSAPLQFTYENPPYGSISPAIGTGVTTVTITGAGFSTAANADTVSFNINGVATPAVGLVCSSTTVCTMQPPAKPSSVTGTLTVPVTMTVNGKSFSIGGFEYLATPVKPPPPPCHGVCI